MAKSRSTFGLIAFALALLARIIMPLGASAKAAIGNGDPLAGAIICFHDSSGAAINKPTNPNPDKPHQECDHCAFTCCQAFIGPLADAPALLSMRLPTKRAPFALAAFTALASRAPPAYQPRGPPLFS